MLLEGLLATINNMGKCYILITVGGKLAISWRNIKSFPTEFELPNSETINPENASVNNFLLFNSSQSTVIPIQQN